MGNQLKALSEVGQSIWLDNIRRSMFASGELHRLIDSGLRGMTSNPTIFEKAFGSGSDYDEQLKSLIGTEHDLNHLFEAIAIDDIRHACDEFRHLYDATNGGDGFVSLEVSPLLAHDRTKTLDAAKRLWAMVDRPNVMIKIPATDEGLPAVTEAIAAGINVNITLIFSVETYEATANAYIAGLEKRAAQGEPIDRIASVASVFVSRIDTAVDKLLEEKIAKGEPLQALLGKTGIANLKLTYQRFRKLFESDRFAKLAEKGAKVQRPLWASTGTKNPAYSDLMYVENLVGPHTVNTLPPATLDALVDHGTVKANTIEDDLAGAHATIEALAKAQISLFDVTQKLQVEGVASFTDSYNAMLAAIGDKQKRLASDQQQVEISLGKTEADPAATLAKLAQDDFLAKLWKNDPTPWSAQNQSAAGAKNALGWLEFPKVVHERAADLRAFAAECARLYSHVVVLGMGGSTLAPGVLRAVFGRVAGFPDLHVLDSTDPAQVESLERALDLPRTLFVVASKSGTTLETEAFFRYFYERVQKTVGASNAGAHFVAITDPGTQLGTEARAAGFRRTFIDDAAIGGRYAALSYFGIVPAALAGYDVATLLDRGLGALQANSRTTRVDRADGVRFGAALATFALAGRDKLTVVANSDIAAFGAWAEHLIAESTGKNGTGIVPIEGEPLGEPEAYGDDRLFVAVGELDGELERRLRRLEEAGHPSIRLRLRDRLDLGAQFALWEIAAVTACAVLGVNPFDQPDVQESKDRAKRFLAAYAKSGSFDEPRAAVDTETAGVLPLAGSNHIRLGSSLESALGAIVDEVRPGDYVALTAFVEASDVHRAELQALRLKIRDATKAATTVGFGPRCLHTTGQLHKGGPATGVIVQITAEPERDLHVPGMTTFATLERAQALGELAALDARGRRGARLHLAGPVAQALRDIGAALDAAHAPAPVHTH